MAAVLKYVPEIMEKIPMVVTIKFFGTSHDQYKYCAEKNNN